MTKRKALVDKIELVDEGFHKLECETLGRDHIDISTPNYPFVVTLRAPEVRKLARWLNAQARRMEGEKK